MVIDNCHEEHTLAIKELLSKIPCCVTEQRRKLNAFLLPELFALYCNDDQIKEGNIAGVWVENT